MGWQTDVITQLLFNNQTYNSQYEKFVELR